MKRNRPDLNLLATEEAGKQGARIRVDAIEWLDDVGVTLG